MKSFVCLVQTPTTIWNETYGICRIRMYSRVKSEKKFISKFGLKTSTTEHLLTSIMVTFGKIKLLVRIMILIEVKVIKDLLCL